MRGAIPAACLTGGVLLGLGAGRLLPERDVHAAAEAELRPATLAAAPGAVSAGALGLDPVRPADAAAADSPRAADSSPRTDRRTVDAALAGAAADGPQDDAELAAQRARLRTYLDSGQLEDWLLAEPGRLDGFLVDRLRREGRDDELFALLDELDDPGIWIEEGRNWRRGKDEARGAQALERGVRGLLAAEEPGDNDAWQLQRGLNELARMDAELAADLALEAHALAPAVDAESDFRLGQLLARAGRGDEALTHMRTHLDDPIHGMAALEQVLGIAPELALAEARLKAEQAAEPSAAQMLVVRALVETGDAQAAAAELDALLASGEDVLHFGSGVAALLQDGEVDVWIDRLPDWCTAGGGAGDDGMWEVSSALYNRLGEALEEDPEGETTERLLAAAFDERVLGRLPLDNLPEIPESLRESHAPQLLRAVATMEQRAGTNDEAWGDIGDRYWELGDRAAAQRAWERALAIDPTDGEWSGNLTNLRDGTLER